MSDNNKYFDVDKARTEAIHLENARRQSRERNEDGDNIHDPSVGLYFQTFEQWYAAGNYDPTQFGDEAHNTLIAKQ